MSAKNGGKVLNPPYVSPINSIVVPFLDKSSFKIPSYSSEPSFFLFMVINIHDCSREKLQNLFPKRALHKCFSFC